MSSRIGWLERPIAGEEEGARGAEGAVICQGQNSGDLLAGSRVVMVPLDQIVYLQGREWVNRKYTQREFGAEVRECLNIGYLLPSTHLLAEVGKVL